MKQLDPNVEAVREKLKARAEAGLQKYGTDTMRSDLDILQWLQHAQDELMDGANYLQRLMSVDVPALQRAASSARPDALAAFDAAVTEELPRVSHVAYDSHEICKHFAGEVRKRIERQTGKIPSPVGELRCDPSGFWYVQWLKDMTQVPKPAKLYEQPQARADLSDDEVLKLAAEVFKRRPDLRDAGRQMLNEPAPEAAAGDLFATAATLGVYYRDGKVDLGSPLYSFTPNELRKFAEAIAASAGIAK